MRSTILLLILTLLPIGLAVGVPLEKSTPYLATNWGLTSPHSDLAWTYDSDPTPAPSSPPRQRILDFNFPPAHSASMDREARGACRLSVEKMRAIGDINTLPIMVVGFADCYSEGPNAERLAMRRAEKTRNFLASLGVNRHNIRVASFSNRYCTAQEWEKIKQSYERRAEIWVLEGTASGTQMSEVQPSARR